MFENRFITVRRKKYLEISIFKPVKLLKQHILKYKRCSPQFNIYAIVRFMRFVNGRKVKIDWHILGDLTRIGEQFTERREHMMVRAIIVELNLSYKLKSDTLVVDFSAWLLELDVNSASHVLAVVIDELFNFFAFLEHFHWLASCLFSSTARVLVQLEFDVTARAETE